MGTLKIVAETASDEQLNALIMTSKNRPLATMEDFSILALRVDRLQQGTRALADSNFTFSRSDCGIAVAYDSIDRLEALLNTLSRHNVRWEMTDIADSMYQG